MRILCLSGEHSAALRHNPAARGPPSFFCALPAIFAGAIQALTPLGVG